MEQTHPFTLSTQHVIPPNPVDKVLKIYKEAAADIGKPVESQDSLYQRNLAIRHGAETESFFAIKEWYLEMVQPFMIDAQTDILEGGFDAAKPNHLTALVLAAGAVMKSPRDIVAAVRTVGEMQGMFRTKARDDEKVTQEDLHVALRKMFDAHVSAKKAIKNYEIESS